jgi:orotidine-5'-phosphate decarboxylase
MSDRNFRQMLEKKWGEGKFVCVGLDPDVDKLPEPLRLRYTEYSPTTPKTQFIGFNRAIVEATMDLVDACKPNLAFYAAHGAEGIQALARTIADIHAIAPDVPVILDAKFADIGNTNVGYAKFAFEYLGADAVTVHPYLGREALQPFLDYKDKGVFVLCRTSNPSAGEFQDLKVVTVTSETTGRQYTTPMYKVVAQHVANEWNKNGNCGLVVGATYPEELAEVRKIVGDMPILIPGIGAQGGDVEKTVKAGMDSRGRGMIINSSRGSIFASSGPDFAEAARRETLKLHNLINQYRKEKT